MANEFKPDLNCNLNPTLQHAVYRDWGIYYKQRGFYDKALSAFAASMEQEENDYLPWLESCKCEFQKLSLNEATTDARNAYNLKSKNNLNIRHQLIDCVYELSQFENSLIECHNTLRKNNGVFNRTECKNRLITISESLECSLGVNAGPCLLNMRIPIKKLQKGDHFEKKQGYPLWKIRKANKLCDVVSEIETRQQKQAPLDRIRIVQRSNLVNHVVLDKSAQDIKFLSKLLQEKRLNLTQLPKSSSEIRQTINLELSRLKRCRKILKERQPIYSKKFMMFKSEELADKHNKILQYRQQFATRREVFFQLEKIRNLMQTGQTEKLLSYVQYVIGDYYRVQFDEVFPRKFEFTSEICNIVGLAYLEQLQIPPDIMEEPLADRIAHLFQLSKTKDNEKNDETKVFVFGDRDSYFRINAVDRSFLTYKKKVDRLEQLIPLVKYPIELCYLNFELATLHLSQSKLEEIKLISKKIIVYAEKCGNWIWMYLGYLMGVKVDITLKLSAKAIEKLQQMQEISQNMSEKLQHFSNTAVLILTEAYAETQRIEHQKKIEKEEELKEHRLARLKFLRKSTKF